MRALLFLLHAAVGTLKMAGDAIVSILWRSNVYGEIVMRMFDVAELQRFCCVTMQSYQKLNTKALLIFVPFATTYLRKSRFSSLLHLKNK